MLGSFTDAEYKALGGGVRVGPTNAQEQNLSAADALTPNGA